MKVVGCRSDFYVIDLTQIICCEENCISVPVQRFHMQHVIGVCRADLIDVAVGR